MELNSLKKHLSEIGQSLLSPPWGSFHHPAIVVRGGRCYPGQMWDWGNWANNIALRQIAVDEGWQEKLFAYEQGSVENFLGEQREDGSIDIVIASSPEHDLSRSHPHRNVHKPVLAQHVAFICKYTEATEWLKQITPKLDRFLTYYEENAKHESGLYYFFDDFAIGVDNDPATFYRPENSSASIYLNSLMYVELGAMSHLAGRIGNVERKKYYAKRQAELKAAINEHCYDEKDGMYYSCDINLRPIDTSVLLHSGAPRHYSTLLQRLGVWSCFLPLWAGIPTPGQAECMVKENLLDERAFWAPYGVRSLSKYEKMYRIVGTCNPSSWQGGVWILSNYFVMKGLARYGYEAEAKALARATVELLRRDYAQNASFHEYYDPEDGTGVFHKGFTSWNALAANILAYLEGRTPVEEWMCPNL